MPQLEEVLSMLITVNVRANDVARFLAGAPVKMYDGENNVQQFQGEVHEFAFTTESPNVATVQWVGGDTTTKKPLLSIRAEQESTGWRVWLLGHETTVEVAENRSDAIGRLMANNLNFLGIEVIPRS